MKEDQIYHEEPLLFAESLQNHSPRLRVDWPKRQEEAMIQVEFSFLLFFKTIFFYQ